ncbi:Malolactic regulator [Lacticaseibacillus rhamnosus]|nr:Malolactic regulator [Lacticaseibacillus rhamnosus]
MVKARPSRLRPLTLRFLSGPVHAHHNALTGAETACKDLKRNGQNPAITLKAAYVPAYAHNALTGAEGCV